MGDGSRRLYWVLLIFGLLGYLWLAWSILRIESEQELATVCLFKSVYGFPCPACGTTRSILHLYAGDFLGSLVINPLGLLAMAALLIVPFWALWDLIMGKRGLFRFYREAEVWIRKPLLGIPFILLVLVNWIWGIAKGL